MKKAITGVFAGVLSIVVLAWAFETMGRVGHEGGSHHHAAAADAEHAADAGHAEDIAAADAEQAADAEHAGTEPAGEIAENSDDDFAERGVGRRNLSRRAMAGLELTDEQREKIKTLRSAYTRDMIRLRADTRLAQVELGEMMNETSPDVNQVKVLAAAVSSARGSVFERSAIFRAEFRNVLTPEQQETLRESFRDRRDGRRDSGMRWRRGGRDSRNRR